MADLYRRLKERRIPRNLVKDLLLLDWWEDKLAKVPGNRELAEAYIAKQLHFPMATLRDHNAQLSLEEAIPCRFKRRQTGDPQDLAAATVLAQRAAQLATDALRDEVPAFPGVEHATNAFLSMEPPASLERLLDCCWSLGIVVIHAKVLPSPKFDGMALYCGDRPVIILASGRSGPAWFVFPLVHELGHLVRKHVRPGSGAITDEALEPMLEGEDQEEREADEFAKDLICRKVPLDLPSIYGTTAEKLASFAHGAGTLVSVLDPGILILQFAFKAQAAGENRWGVAQGALARLKLDSGAHELLAKKLSERIDLDALSESSARFLRGALSLKE